jgi:hypothetical protein
MPSGRFLLLAEILFIYSIACFGENLHGSKEKIEAIPVNNSNLHLEVEQAPLEQIFKIIESQTSIKLHISSMPEKLVTATCAGTTLEVLKCVLGRDVNLIYQYSDESSASNLMPQLAEVWVLSPGSSKQHQLSKDNRNQSICGTTANLNIAHQERQQQISAGGKITLSANEIENLFKLSQSTNPMQRKEALSRLALVDQADDDIREIMEDALQDQSSSVRAQAVFGLARRNSPNIDSVLSEALHDSNVSVRLMAVSNAGENVYLLQSALNDTDSVVRNLASMKLDQISKMNISQ